MVKKTDANVRWERKRMVTEATQSGKMWDTGKTDVVRFDLLYFESFCRGDT